MLKLDTTISNQSLQSFFPKGPFNPHPTHLQPKPASSYALAGSDADLSRFSHVPTSTSAFTDTKVVSNALSPDSKASAIANASAIFIGGSNVPVGQTNGETEALSIADGNGLGYAASAIARTEVKGLDFYIKPKETFSFNFTGNMSLVAQGSNRRQQSYAQGRTIYQIYGTNACGRQTLLDRLIIEGRQYSSGLGVAGAMFSKGFKLNVQSQPVSFASNELSFNGTYSRTFNSAMRITVVETQQTNAQVQFAPKGKRFK